MSKILIIGKEMLRISPKDAKKIEASIDGGRIWILRYIGTSATGEFVSLADGGKVIIAITAKGTFHSTDGGRRWIQKAFR